MTGQGGNDVVLGGDGDDFDFVIGNSGTFTPGDISQDGGNDLVVGEGGGDILLGEHSPFDGVATGDSSNDLLLGGDDDNDLVGDSRDDAGTDSGDGRDDCQGDAGIDTAIRCEAVTGVP